MNLTFECVNAIVFCFDDVKELRDAFVRGLVSVFISSKDLHRKSRDRLISASSDSSVALTVRFPASGMLVLLCLRDFVDCLWLIVSACYLALFRTQLQAMSWLPSVAIVCPRSVQVNIRMSGQWG